MLNLSEADKPWALALAVIVTIATIVVVALLGSRSRRRTVVPAHPAVRPDARGDLIAEIYEEPQLTGGGTFAVVCAVLWNVLGLLAFVFSSTAFAQAAIILLFIAGNQLLCTFVLLGRRSKYLVVRRRE